MEVILHKIVLLVEGIQMVNIQIKSELLWWSWKYWIYIVNFKVCHFTNLSSPFAIVFYSTMPKEVQNMISKALSIKTSLIIQENQFNVKVFLMQLSAFSLIVFSDSNIDYDFKLDQRLKLSKLNTYSSIIQHDGS